MKIEEFQHMNIDPKFDLSFRGGFKSGPDMVHARF